MHFTRRDFLKRVGAAGGASLVHEAMTGLGLLATPAQVPLGLSVARWRNADVARARRRVDVRTERVCRCDSGCQDAVFRLASVLPERRTIARIAGAAALEARRHLPALAPQITLQVHSGKDVVPELGATAVAVAPDWIRCTVDSDHPDGVVTIAETHLRGALFHEFHHLVRGTTLQPQTLMDQVVFEGMATAFERDFAGVTQLWAEYPSDVEQWVEELASQPSTAKRTDWMFQHPDGRPGSGSELERIWSIVR